MLPLEPPTACENGAGRFMQARDCVRICPMFKKLVSSDQKRIAEILFEVFPPTE